ncbi:hypothetical protein ACHAWT_008845 [Skeletonema menzelii]
MIKLSLAFFFLVAYAVAYDNVTGNLEAWDSIFASREYEVLVHAKDNNLFWTEGPVLITNSDGGGDYETTLLFSDVIAAKTYSLHADRAIQDRTKEKFNDDEATKHMLDKYLHIVKERSGDSPPEDDNWRAEPGGNGLAALSQTPLRALVMCQHGARRLAILNLDTGTTHSLASEYEGRRLNGPNDVVLHSENGELFAYFTDPVYAWLEKDRFEDLPYLDEQVKSQGPGHCGVYRIKLDEDDKSHANAKNEVELITSDMMRPNGIDFIDENHLIVSECCQGSHLDGCKSGTSRWSIFEQQDYQERTPSSSWAYAKTIEDTVPIETAEGGCADGFAVYEYVNGEKVRKQVLLASCFGGLCIVDTETGAVVSRMWTARGERRGCRISNVAIGQEYAFLTGSCGILTLPLTRGGSTSQSKDTEASLHAEL